MYTIMDYTEQVQIIISVRLKSGRPVYTELDHAVM